MLDGNVRIGDTDSIFGIYQLQAAISALADWTNDTFEPWFTTLLARATVIARAVTKWTDSIWHMKDALFIADERV
jgi:hypothetical protein